MRALNGTEVVTLKEGEKIVINGRVYVGGIDKEIEIEATPDPKDIVHTWTTTTAKPEEEEEEEASTPGFFEFDLPDFKIVKIIKFLMPKLNLFHIAIYFIIAIVVLYGVYLIIRKCLKCCLCIL